MEQLCNVPIILNKASLQNGKNKGVSQGQIFTEILINANPWDLHGEGGQKCIPLPCPERSQEEMGRLTV